MLLADEAARADVAPAGRIALVLGEPSLALDLTLAAAIADVDTEVKFEFLCGLTDFLFWSTASLFLVYCVAAAAVPVLLV